MLNTLSEEKKKIVEKYNLFFEEGKWYQHKENTHKALIFKHIYLERHNVLDIVFRINKLCIAKVKYFRANIDDFEPCKYHYKDKFVKTELWDSEFLKHKKSKYILDYRYLQSIKEYDDFLKLCDEMENYEEICDEL